MTHQISPEAIRAVADRLGEDRAKTASAISASVPSVLAALSDVARTDKGAADLQNAISSKVTAAGAPPDDPARLLGSADEPSPDFLDEELGPKSWRLSDALARTSGLRRESAHALQSGVTSLALLTLGQNLNTGEARTLLEEQRGEALRSLPPTMTSAFEARAAPAVVPQLPGSRPSWILPVLFAVAVLVMILSVRGARHRTPVPPLVSPRAALNQPPEAVTPTAPRIPGPQRMKRGQRPSLDLAEDSPAQGLASFLAVPGGAASRRFTLSGVSFGADDAKPTAASMSTLDDFARVLTAYPGSTMRVESFTDDAGDQDHEVDLSRRRSEAIKSALVQRGVAAARIQTAGLGQSNPIASNDTAAGRARNRRSELVVTRP